MNYLWQLCIQTTMLTSAMAIIAYDCGHERVNFTVLSLLSVGPCLMENNKVHHKEEDIQLLQMSEVASIHIFQCKLNIIQSIYHCGMFSHLSLVPGGLSTFVADISHDDCMSIHKLKSFKLQNGRTIADIKMNASTTHTEVIAGSIDASGNCKGAPYSSASNSWDDVIVMHAIEFTITDYSSSVRLDDNMVILRNNVLCPYLANKCTDPDYGMSFWDLLPDNSCENLQYDVLWQGKANKVSTVNTNGELLDSNVVYTVTSGEIVFALEIKKQISVCKFHGYQTEHPRLVIVPKATTEFWFKKRLINVRNLDLFTYVNSKFVYTEHHIKGQVEKLYSNLIQKRCELERENLKTQLTIASHYPAEFALMRTKEPGYTAVPRGEVIYLIKCQPVEVTIRKTDRCYMELPVMYAENEFFVAPITHLLQRRGNEIPCSDMLSPGYHVNGEWYGLNPILHRMKQPNQITPSTISDWTYEDPGKLISAGIYSSKSLDNLRHQIMYPSERQVITNIITQSIMGHDIDHQEIKTTNLFSPNIMDSLAESLKTKVWGIFSTFGHIYAVFLAIYGIFKITKFAIEVVLNGRLLKAVYGWSWKLTAAVWNSLTHHLVHHQQRKDNVTLNEVIVSSPVQSLNDQVKDSETCSNQREDESATVAAIKQRVEPLYASLSK